MADKNKAPEYDGSTPIKYPKQEQFCHEYVVDLKGARAARDSGYSEKTANTIAANLLAKVNIQKRIEYLKTQNIKRVKNKEELELSADAVLAEVGRMAFANINDFMTVQDDGYAYIDMSKATREQLAAIASMEVIDLPPVTLMGSDGQKMERQVLKVKLKMWDKIKSLEMLMKHFDLMKEKVEVEGLDKMIDALHAGRARVAASKKKSK